MSEKAKCCPRCLTIKGDPEDGAIHTCNPTPAWREMESQLSQAREALDEAEEYWARGNPELVKKCRAALAAMKGEAP